MRNNRPSFHEPSHPPIRVHSLPRQPAQRKYFLTFTMRIALIITELHPGGAEGCFVNLAIALKAQGHEVAVWELWPPPPAGKRRLTEQLDQHDVPWKSGGAVKARHFPAATRWLQRELKAFRPDIVQSFLFHANLAAVLATRSLPCKLFGGARVKQPQRWRQWLQRWMAGRMEKLICVSHGVQEHCWRVEKIDPAKLLVIPNGIDLSRLEEPSHSLDWSQFGLPAAARVLLVVGRLDPQKGVEPLMRRADAILGELPEHHLVFMGEGPSCAALEAMRAALQHAARVHLVGWQPEAVDWMRKCELLLLPAVYEGMPNVVMEAMAVARPVVAFDVEGVRELLDAALPAPSQIVRAGDWKALLETLRRLARDQELREQLGAANHRRVAQHFQLQAQLAKYIDAYQGAGKKEGRALSSSFRE